MKTDISYPKDANTPVSHLPFSPAVRVGNLIFVSGQASVDATGKLVPDTFEGEFRRSLENLRKILESAGSGLKHVVQTRNYLRDDANLSRYNELYREYFSEPFPARTTITNCLPVALHYEIECVAVVKES
ncbi:reactive intermediate/imine deaminase [Nibricoccus aquaticus]|uniref:Reactive intermediate/imine deaminase n=1 Tax=Nibricoccus aquaticus TaxID=2576891 RepID=A0A290QMF4_9BACT|nr:RidA family protein [Nibricoccus aquaticus]ATC65791.1 reactive intermediate/imine deaminase [Nibricoccus aquaticus]